MEVPICCGQPMKRLFQTSAWDCDICGIPKYDARLKGPSKKSLARLNSMAGSARKNNKISKEERAFIIKLSTEGLSINKIAKRFNIGWAHCKDIITKGVTE